MSILAGLNPRTVQPVSQSHLRADSAELPGERFVQPRLVGKTGGYELAVDGEGCYWAGGGSRYRGPVYCEEGVKCRGVDRRGQEGHSGSAMSTSRNGCTSTSMSASTQTRERHVPSGSRRSQSHAWPSSGVSNRGGAAWQQHCTLTSPRPLGYQGDAAGDTTT